MAQRRRGLGFLQEARSNLGAKRKLGREEFHRHRPLQATIPRLVDNAIPTAADLAIELIVGTENALDVRA